MSLTNELKFDAENYQINSISLINSFLLNINFSFSFEGQS